MVEQATGVELTDATFVSLSIAIRDQISILEDLEVRTIKEASILTKLGQLLEMVTKKTKESNQENIDRVALTKQAFEFAQRERQSSEDSIEILNQRLNILKTTSDEERISAEAVLERLIITQDAEQKIQQVKQKFIDAGFSQQEAAQRASEAIQQINNQKELEIQIANQNESLEIKKAGDEARLNSEKNTNKDIQDARDVANAEFAAKEAAFSLRLFEARGEANERQVQEQVANDRFIAEQIRINADKTLQDAEKDALIKEAQSKKS